MHRLQEQYRSFEHVLAQGFEASDVVEAQAGLDGAEWVSLPPVLHPLVLSVVSKFQQDSDISLIIRYIIAPRFRAAIAAIWQLPEIQHWWLPNDEGYSDSIREVRGMSEERMNQPLDDFRENVRDMKSLFWKLSVDGQEEEESPSSSHTSYT